MEVRFTIKERGPTPRGMIGKFNDCSRKAGTAMGVAWWSRFRPKHFTHEGAREYGYAKRRGEGAGRGTKEWWQSYTGRKQRVYHHTLPLVWSGASRELAKTGDIRCTATRSMTRVYVRIRAPALKFINPVTHIDLAEEMTTISDRERVELLKVYEDVLAACIKAIT